MTSDINVRLWLIQEMGRPTSGAGMSSQCLVVRRHSYPHIIAANNPYLALLHALTALPESPLTQSAAQRTHFACLMFTSLIRHSEQCKEAAKDLLLASATANPGAEDDDDPPPTLVSTLAGSLALSFRPRSLAREQGHAAEVREWDRVMSGYLALICIWCWESPPTVREVLEEGGALGTVRLFYI